MKRERTSGLYLSVTRVYDAQADGFDPDRLIREAVMDEDLVAAATIALESYGWQLYNFILRQVHPEEVETVDEVFTRVADEILRGLPELARGRVRDWIYTLVHGAWIRTQAGDPRAPLQDRPAFARRVQQMIVGYRSANGLGRCVGRSTSGGGRRLVAAGGGSGLAMQRAR